MNRLFFILCGLASTWAYAWGFHASKWTSGTSYLKHPIDCLLYFLSFYGNPFQRGLLMDELQVSRVFGTLVFLMFCFTVYAAYQMKQLRAIAPWLVLCLAMVVEDLMLCCGRQYTVLLPVRYDPLAAIFVVSLCSMVNVLLKTKL
jgi:hypothetical protein